MSLALYYQQVGRGARLDPENLNKVCTVTDLVGMTKKFGKVEDLRIANHPTFGWCVIGSDGKPLTNVPMY